MSGKKLDIKKKIVISYLLLGVVVKKRLLVHFFRQQLLHRLLRVCHLQQVLQVRLPLHSHHLLVLLQELLVAGHPQQACFALPYVFLIMNKRISTVTDIYRIIKSCFDNMFPPFCK